MLCNFLDGNNLQYAKYQPLTFPPQSCIHTHSQVFLLQACKKIFTWKSMRLKYWSSKAWWLFQVTYTLKTWSMVAFIYHGKLTLGQVQFNILDVVQILLSVIVLVECSNQIVIILHVTILKGKIKRERERENTGQHEQGTLHLHPSYEVVRVLCIGMVRFWHQGHLTYVTKGREKKRFRIYCCHGQRFEIMIERNPQSFFEASVMEYSM